MRIYIQNIVESQKLYKTHVYIEVSLREKLEVSSSLISLFAVTLKYNTESCVIDYHYVYSVLVPSWRNYCRNYLIRVHFMKFLGNS